MMDRGQSSWEVEEYVLVVVGNRGALHKKPQISYHRSGYGTFVRVGARRVNPCLDIVWHPNVNLTSGYIGIVPLRAPTHSRLVSSHVCMYVWTRASVAGKDYGFPASNRRGVNKTTQGFESIHMYTFVSFPVTYYHT